MPFFRDKKPDVPQPKSKTTVPFVVVDCPRGCGARVKQSVATGDTERHYRADKAAEGTGVREVCE